MLQVQNLRRMISYIALLPLVLEFSCAKPQKEVVVFPRPETKAHYTLNSDAFKDSELSYVLGSFLCRIDGCLVYLRSCKVHSTWEYVLLRSPGDLCQVNHPPETYSANIVLNLHGSKNSPIFLDHILNLCLSSWILPNSAVLSFIPPLDNRLLGVRAGLNQGAFVYEDYKSKDIVLGRYENGVYSKKTIVNNNPIIGPYEYYGQNCKVMLMDKYTCLWYPSMQCIAIEDSEQRIIVRKLDDLLSSTKYKGSIIATPGLVCDDGNNLYIGIYTPEQISQQNITVGSITANRRDTLYTIIKCTIDIDCNLVSVEAVDTLQIYGFDAAMEYFKGFLFILSGGTELDTIRIGS